MHSDEERRLAHMGQIVLHFFPMILRVILTEVNEINQYACRSIQNNRDFKSKLFEDETSIVLTMINNGYSFFNIQLCYKMLRHFEWINPPRKGWGNEIEDADIELADDIERIRQISNTVILMPLHDVREIIYSSVIQKVKEISVRIARFKKESNKSEDSIYSCEIGNKETLEEDEISTLLNNLRKMHEIKNNPFPCNPVTKGLNRYARLGLLIVNAFPNMYREIVSSNISAKMLYRQIQKNLKQNPRKFDKLTHDERTGLNLLKNGSYGEIDFTTIYKLIRAFAVVDDPNQGWAKTPSASDTEIADDIERMRIIRNKIVHKIKAEISKVEMNDLFTEITSIASRVDKYLGKQPGAGFEIEVSKYRTCPLDHHLEQKYTQALQEIENMKEQFTFEEVHFYYGNSFQTFVENVKQKLGKPEKKKIVIILEDIDGDEEKINQLNKMKKELSSSSSLIKFEGAYRGSLVMNILIDESVLITESQLGSALHSFLKQVFRGIDEDFSPEGVIHAALVAMEEKLDLEIMVEDNGWDTCFSETPEISNSLCLDIMVKDEFFETDLRMQRELQGFAQSLRRSNGSLKKTAVSAILSSHDSEHEVETKKPSLSTEIPEKMYLCVSGIDKEQTNEIFFNYIEAKSKVDVIRKESLRTVDEPEHAVVVFEDKIDIAKLKVACTRKVRGAYTNISLGNSSLKFGEIDPPRRVIASSVDKLTENDFKDYLTKRKKQDVVRVHTTEDGLISARLKNTAGVMELLKDTNIKISGSEVVISVMYFCDHGTFWERSLHRVAIPGPFKPSVSDSHIRSFIIDITSACNENLEQYHACLNVLKDELYIECTIDPKDRMARQKVKEWKNNVQKAWEEFVNISMKKRELQITDDTKDALLEHINKTKDLHKSEELKVISPDETGSMKFVFVGRSKIVENYVEQISAKKLEIEEELNRKKKIITGSMKLKPIEIALITKEDKFGELKHIAPDFSCKPNTESGAITFTGVEEDISKAKVMIYEIKNNNHSWRIDSLSGHMCQLLKRKPVSDIVHESFSDDNISIVWDISDNHVTVCTSLDNRPHIEKVFTDTILEDEIKLDKASQDVLMLDEWAEKKTSINNIHRDTANIDDSYNDRIIVTATSDVFDGIMEELDIFITNNSIKEDEITIREDEKFKFFKNHCKDWIKELEVKYSDQKLDIHFGRQSVKISGTPKVIDIVDDEIQNQLRKIDKDICVISEPGVHSLVSDKKESDALVSPVEKDTKTVITVDPNSVNKQGFRIITGNKKTDDEYAWEQASKNNKKRVIGYKPPNAGPVVCRNGTKVILVKKEDLGKQKADVIICSTNWQLDLSCPDGKSIVNAAGPEILAEIKQKYSDGIEHGEIAAVRGFKINCKEVYLAALPGWSYGGEKIIDKCVTTCLIQASKYKSIVFPALGTGNLRYPRELIAETMYKCVSQFDQSNTSLKEVKFLCYDDDTIRAFEQEELRQVNPGFQPQRAAASGPASGPKYYKKHNTSVKVVKGDLGTQKVDVLVCVVPEDLNLESAGGAGKSLMLGLGNAIQNDILGQHPDGVTNGGFAAVKFSSPPGQCKSIYLTSLDSWDNQKTVPNDEDKQICKFVYQCLETAEKSGYKSIGIPAMGTGTIGYPHHLMAKYMYDMVEKFVTKHKSSKLTDVKLIAHSKDVKSITAFYDEEKKRLSAPAHVPAQAHVHQQFASGDSSGSMQAVPEVLSDTEFQVGSVKLTVEKGDILSKKCGAIVNGTNHDFDLTNGNVSQALRMKCDAKKLDLEVSKKDSRKPKLANKKDIVCKHGTRIILVYDTLRAQKADVVVCSFNPMLDSFGGSAKSIELVEGVQFFDEVNAQRQSLRYGEVAAAKCKRMQCKEVYFTSIPNYNRENEKILRCCIMECLTKASNSKYVSIVFCALGTGNLCYPRDAVAKILYNCVREFDESNTSVKDVRFLCYMHDTKTVQAFEIEEMNQWREYYQHTGDRGISKWPQEWEDQGSRNMKAFRLLNTSLEYKTVENKFIESVFNGRPEWSAQFNKQTFKVTKIERVQNVSLYDMYKGEKALLENQNPEGTKNELELWHGTPNTTVNMINSYGFKQFHKSTKELKWDEGVYFTADASHAAMKGMTTAHAADEQCIYLCKVLTGVHCKREIGMLELPFRQDGTMLKFDSAADDKYDPVAGYIIFNFKQAYPQYCIKYKY